MRKTLALLTGAAMSIVMFCAAPSGQASAQPTTAQSGAAKGLCSDSCHPTQVVDVVGDHKGLRFSTTRVAEGLVTFRASTTNPGSEVSLFRPRRGVTAAQVIDGVMRGFTDDAEERAAAARANERLAVSYGLTQVMPDTPASATVYLRAGTYYAAEIMFGRPAPEPLTFVVEKRRGHHAGADRLSCGVDARISLRSGHRLTTRGQLPTTGSVVVRNGSDAIQIAVLSPIATGTAEQQLQDWFDAGGQGQFPFARAGDSVGTDALSPGRRLKLSYSLPAGTYLLASYVPDKVTGLPAAFHGMFKVVELR